MLPGIGRAPADDAELEADDAALEEVELERVKLPEAEEDMVDWVILDMMTMVGGRDCEDNS
jgi:hypothetical protein